MEVHPTSRVHTEHGNLRVVWRTRVGPGLGWTLPLTSRRWRMRRREKEGAERSPIGEKEKSCCLAATCQWTAKQK